MELKYLKDVATLKLDKEKCIGCRMCTEVCPHGVFAIVNNKAEILDLDKCMECGACAHNCTVQAINVDSGVGCAAAVLNKLLGKTETECCGPSNDGCSTGGCCS